MRLSHQFSLDSRPGPLPLWDTIERIRVTLRLTEVQIATILKMSLNQFRRHKDFKRELSVLHIMSLAEYLAVSFELIMSGKIDYTILAHRFFGNRDIMPDRYRMAAFSRVRNSLFILDFVELHFGWRARAHLLQHFQMNEAIFSNADNLINFLFPSDLCDHLSKYFMTDDVLASIGSSSMKGPAVVPLVKELKGVKSVSELYERIFTDLMEKYFEESFAYQLTSLNQTECVFTCKPSPRLVAGLGENAIGGPATAFVRRGLAGGYPALLGLPAALVKQTASLHHGDKELRYEVDFSWPQRVFSNRGNITVGM